jgi:hypothetical protein
MTEPFSERGPSMLTMETIAMTTTEPRERASSPLRPERAAASRPDRLILVYDGDSGLGALLLDVVKKAVGREECALCEITNGPLGKRGAWRACETRLGVIVDELHRDQLPDAWGVSRSDLPCILGRSGTERPFAVVSRDEIISCRGSVDALEAKLVAALAIEIGGGR